MKLKMELTPDQREKVYDFYTTYDADGLWKCGICLENVSGPGALLGNFYGPSAGMKCGTADMTKMCFVCHKAIMDAVIARRPASPPPAERKT